MANFHLLLLQAPGSAAAGCAPRGCSPKAPDSGNLRHREASAGSQGVVKPLDKGSQEAEGKVGPEPVLTGIGEQQPASRK